MEKQRTQDDLEICEYSIEFLEERDKKRLKGGKGWVCGQEFNEVCDMLKNLKDKNESF